MSDGAVPPLETWKHNKQVRELPSGTRNNWRDSKVYLDSRNIWFGKVSIPLIFVLLRLLWAISWRKMEWWGDQADGDDKTWGTWVYSEEEPKILMFQALQCSVLQFHFSYFRKQIKNVSLEPHFKLNIISFVFVVASFSWNVSFVRRWKQICEGKKSFWAPLCDHMDPLLFPNSTPVEGNFGVFHSDLAEKWCQ